MYSRLVRIEKEIVCQAARLLSRGGEFEGQATIFEGRARGGTRVDGNMMVHVLAPSTVIKMYHSKVCTVVFPFSFPSPLFTY